MKLDDVRAVVLRCAMSAQDQEGLAIRTDLYRAEIFPEPGWSGGFTFRYRRHNDKKFVSSSGLVPYHFSYITLDTDGVRISIYLFKDNFGSLALARFVRWDRKSIVSPDLSQIRLVHEKDVSFF